MKRKLFSPFFWEWLAILCAPRFMVINTPVGPHVYSVGHGSEP